MAVPAILMAVGTGLQVFSQWMANLDQARAEYENQKFFEEQAGLARDKMNRDLDIADREYEYRKGATIGAEASSGVDVGSGSAVNNIAAVTAAKIKELAAIKTQGEFEMKLARLKARRSGQSADTLSDTGFNLLQGSTTLLNNYTKSKGFGTDFSLFKDKPSGHFGNSTMNESSYNIQYGGAMGSTV